MDLYDFVRNRLHKFSRISKDLCSKYQFKTLATNCTLVLINICFVKVRFHSSKSIYRKVDRILIESRTV